MQDLLLNLTTDNLDGAKDEILRSTWIHDEKGIRQLAAAFRLTASIRISLMALLASLLQKLRSAASPDNLVELLRQTILTEIFRSFAYIKPFPNESSNFAFLYRCFRSEAFDISELDHHIGIIMSDSAYRRSVSWFFGYFAPEMYHFNADHANRMLVAIEHAVNQRHFPQVFKTFLDRLPEFRAKKWKNLRSAREIFKHQSTLLSRIREDDVDGLLKASQSPLFSVETRIHSSLHLPTSYLQNFPTLIQVAAFFGSVRCFRFLQMNGAELRCTDYNSLTLPQFAVAGGNLEIVRACEQWGLSFFGTLHTSIKFHRDELFDWFMLTPPPDSDLDADGETPLHAACESNNLYAIHRLLDGGADPDALSYRGWTPLRLAIRRGFYDAADMLLSLSNADANPRTHTGLTPFHLAAKHGDLALLKLLLENGADINALSQTGYSGLHFAVMNDHHAIVNYLLTLTDIDVNASPNESMTPLCVAITENRPAIATSLLADPRVNVNGFSGPVFLAAKYMRASIFADLLARPDLDLSVRGPRGEGLLNLVHQDNRLSFVQSLLARPDVNVNAAPEDGDTALHVACLLGFVEVGKALLAHPDIDVNKKNGGGNTALHYACASGCAAMQLALVSRPDTKVNLLGSAGSAAVHSFVAAGEVKCLRALCAREDSDVNLMNAPEKPLSPLMLAAITGRLDMLEILLECPRIDVNARLPDGTRALDLAVLGGKEKAARMLLEKMGRKAAIAKAKPGKKRSVVMSRLSRRGQALVVA
jgi:ankyrin repeat protein